MSTGVETMKQKTHEREQLLDAIGKARSNGAEFIFFGGQDRSMAIDDAMSYLRRQPEDLGGNAEEFNRWYECDAVGNRILRTKEIYGGITRHESGVLVWNGSSDVFCGNWGGIKGLPRPFGPAETPGESRSMVAVSLDPQFLDDDTLELACNAAIRKGDKTPRIHEAFRVNDTATIVTFDGWP